MLLFDENLSPRLRQLLADCFPGSMHVHHVGLEREQDAEIWRYAAARGLTIVTKDTDFADWQGVYGFPPDIVWLRMGNASTRRISQKLRDHQEDVRMLRQRDDVGLLVVR